MNLYPQRWLLIRHLWLAILLGNFIALAIVIGFGVWIARSPSPPAVNHCPPSDAANPWCAR